ncbi:MAG TPA: glucose 1-dehydrogenase [Mycobacteriales bacterium]|jgi:NAD(P)-dependent dehydrogenase (short-subunit alcohol dehydrogenase family)|nr:glucose 1-dehydrogenase [Mycobacteriales bacterium]
MGRLDDKVVIVTGSGQGIGEGIALAAAAEGANVVCAGRTLEKVQRTAATIEERGVKALAVQCDVRRQDEVNAAVAATLERFGRIDGLVNNAQMVALGPILEITEKDARRTWESGFLGSLWFMQASYEALKESKGSVVNLGTGSALRNDLPGFTLYAGTKEMIRTMSRMAALEWGKDGIRVNAMIPNGMSPGLEMWSQFAPQEYEDFVSTIPLGRVGRLEEDVGRAVAFLLSDDAAYVTGSTLMVDGGQAYLR